ncbi:MAG: LysR family transcriptional regulator [Betaproteobacteria bacterium]
MNPMRSSLDIRTLKVILAVADKGSMTGAARVLGMTQSAVSQVVQRIEEEIGAQLFERAFRPLRLTVSGGVLARGAEHLIGEADQLFAATRAGATLPELRIGLIDSFAGTVGPMIARTLMEKVTNLMLWSGLTSRLSQDFLNRHIDLLICAEEIEDADNLRQVALFREPFILAMHKSTPATPGSNTLESLSWTQPMIRYSARSHTGMQIERHFRRIGVRPPRRMEMDSSESLFAMVAAGVGWSITTPLCVLHGCPDLSKIRLEPLPGVEFSRQVVLVHRRGEYDELADRIVEISATAMNEQILPQVHRFAPWAACQIAGHIQGQPVQSSVQPPKLVYRSGT